MKQRRISIVDTKQQVAFFLIQDLDRAICNDSITTVAHTLEEATERTRQTKDDVIITDRRKTGIRGLEIAGPFIIHLFTQLVQEALRPSPTEPALTTQEYLRDPLTSYHLSHELPVPLTHTLNHTGALSQEGDNPQDHLTRDPHHAVGMWSTPQDLNRPGEGPIKQFPGYLQTFNLHHIPP